MKIKINPMAIMSNIYTFLLDAKREIGMVADSSELTIEFIRDKLKDVEKMRKDVEDIIENTRTRSEANYYLRDYQIGASHEFALSLRHDIDNHIILLYRLKRHVVIKPTIED